MFTKMTFEEWLDEYNRVYAAEATKWEKKSGHHGLIPEGFDETLLQQYTAYCMQMESRQLVFATWALAIATIILCIITVFVK